MTFVYGLGVHVQAWHWNQSCAVAEDDILRMPLEDDAQRKDGLGGLKPTTFEAGILDCMLAFWDWLSWKPIFLQVGS